MASVFAAPIKKIKEVSPEEEDDSGTKIPEMEDEFLSLFMDIIGSRSNIIFPKMLDWWIYYGFFY